VKICLVSNFYPPMVQGGAEIYVGRVARALAEDHQVVVISTQPGFRLTPRREVTPEGIVVYRLSPFFRAMDLYHPLVAAGTTHVMKRERPDLVHVHGWKGLSLAAVLSSIPSGAPHIPAAMTLHDDSLLAAPPMIRRLNRALVNRVGLVISPSHYVLDQHLQRGFFRLATQQILPYGLDLHPSLLAAEGRGGGSKATFDILYLRRVERHKGIEVLVRTFRGLSDSALRLHIAGTGPALDACRTLAGGDDRIHFYGFVVGERRRSLVENADCMVVPSIWPDNYPVSIQEAFLSGPVVIASRIGGIPEMIRDGVNGLLVEPGSEAGLTAAIERLRTTPELATKLRTAAAETARLYDMRFHIAHLTDAYRRLLVTDRLRPFDQNAA
jgi:glycosyltransferase involved in cell wall biosynthesis